MGTIDRTDTFIVWFFRAFLIGFAIMLILSKLLLAPSPEGTLTKIPNGLFILSFCLGAYISYIWPKHIRPLISSRKNREAKSRNIDGIRVNSKIHHTDDRHFITIAGTRGGKGRSAIIPNLIEWPHSALVIDPKGTNAAVTASRRGRGKGRVRDCLHQDVHIVDPFKIVSGVTSASYNPLDALDLQSMRIVEDIRLIADAIIVPESGSNAGHFTDGAKTIIAGIIAQLLTDNRKSTLLDLRRFITGSEEDQIAFSDRMAINEAFGGLAKAAVSLLKSAGDNEGGGFRTTVIKNTKWIDSLAMKDVLHKSDFSINDLKNGNTTIYIVLPPDLLEEHKRFMRLFVNLAINSMSVGAKAKNPVLFILDEFFSLGTLSKMEQAAGLLGSYNLKLWPIIQDIPQLKKNYPGIWETFISGAGAIQAFSINDPTTIEYLVRKIGEGEGTQFNTYISKTRELEERLGRHTTSQVYIPNGKRSMFLNRIKYDKFYPKEQYSPDPDHPD